MKIISATNYFDICEKTSNLVAKQLRQKPNSVLGLATGSTFLGVYEKLIQNKEIDFSQTRTINLDEYVGLDGEDKNSYRYFMERNLFSHINILPSNTFIPSGMAKDIKSECENYDKLIKNLGGIDLQLLGLGLNGHIGFNEPGDCFVANTHSVALQQSTRQANARFFGDIDKVPASAITVGIKTILQAKKVVLCVSGLQKAKILIQVLFGPILPNVQGSILQLHQNLIIIADKEALSLWEEGL